MKRHWLYQLIAVTSAMGGGLLSHHQAWAEQGCPPVPCPPGCTIEAYSAPTPPVDPCAPGQGSVMAPHSVIEAAPIVPDAAASESSAPQASVPAPAPIESTPIDPAPSPSTPSPSDLAMSAPTTRSISSGLSSGQYSAMDTVGGYIDDALIRSRIRVRYDSVDGGNSDRAEFLYGTYNLGGVAGPSQVDVLNLDYEEVSTYLELALSRRMSVFAELGVRWNDVVLGPFSGPNADDNAAGLSDMNAGFKYALHSSATDALSFQFKVIIPTGDETQALGTGHVSLQPGILYREQFGSRFTVFGELQDWIGVGTTPIGPPEPNAGQHLGGNVLRYGLGFGYDLAQARRGHGRMTRLTAVNEFVGWTVLDGFGFRPNNAIINLSDMDGDTIFNIKTGLRYSTGVGSLYVGYGWAVTDDVWYDDIIRVEWQRTF